MLEIDCRMMSYGENRDHVQEEEEEEEGEEEDDSGGGEEAWRSEPETDWGKEKKVVKQRFPLLMTSAKSCTRP